jgi:hypothetical protein
VWALLLGTQLLAVEEDVDFKSVALAGNRIAAVGTARDDETSPRADVWLWEPIAR